MRKGLIILLAVFVVVVAFWGPIEATSKALFLVSQEFPQVPVKPLHSLTQEPRVDQVEFGSEQKIVADVVLPAKGCPCPGLILVMGVFTEEKDRPLLLGFADTLARLGYVAMWPRSQAIEDKSVKAEDPQVFTESFQYLESRPEIDDSRISFLGFSVGSSFAMVAAEDPKIANEVHSLVFFGGYYNLFDYFTSLANSTMVVDGEVGEWNPAEGATSHAEEILELEGTSLDVFREGGLSEEQEAQLSRLSPDIGLDNFKARLFILHDKSDSYVPWTESQKLRDALEGRVLLTYHLADLFAHVQPEKGVLNLDAVRELWGMYRFLYQVFDYL